MQPLKFFASMFKSNVAISKLIPLKSISYLHGEPIVIWKQEEIDQMIINEAWSMQ